jgi:hypothetical protein
VRWLIPLFVVLPLTLWGCADTAGTMVSVDDDDAGEGDDDAGDDDAGDDDAGDDDTAEEVWADADMMVHSPESGEFVPLGTAMHLSATVYDDEGTETEWDDIHWTTDQDDDFEWVGRDGEVEDFPVGRHTITAKTKLPNGDKLTYAVGGVLVQHINAGVYSGTVNINIDMEFQGYPISANCVGGIDFVVDVYGEFLEGTGACIASVVGLFDLPLDLIIDGEMTDNEVEGTIGVSVGGWFDLPAPFTGEFPAEGEMFAEFSYDLSGTTVAGTIDAHRVALTP